MVKRNVLAMKKVFELERFLQRNEEKLKTEGPTYRAVADWATKELGYHVSEGNVESVARESGVTWEVKTAPPSAETKKLRDKVAMQVVRLDALEARCRDIEDRLVRALVAQQQSEKEQAMLRMTLEKHARLISSLYQRLGEPVPEGQPARNVSVIGNTRAG